jgi:2-C-methyl-D-erythritol 2,4-cyclodiphosphate synthase
LTTLRIGNGYDVHQLVEGRPLIIGGVNIPHYKGALGHSDADVLLHAIIDALLGAAALGDIGLHFPDTNPEFKNISSTILLVAVRELLFQAGYVVGNIDSTIILQSPKIETYIPEMRKIIAAILKVDVAEISVKATTTERLGMIGREEGIAAFATLLIYKQEV